jgi:hypothetical protein
MNRLGIVAIMVILFSGCASVEKGRFTAIDLDLRTPEQITAQIPENTCIYASDEEPTIEPATPKIFPFDLLFNFLNVMKGRIQIFNLEWKSNQ